MTMGRRGPQQESMLVPAERGPSHTFYDRLNEELDEAAFDKKVEALCERFFETEETRGRPSIQPGMYFRMLMVGYFEGIESERGIEWRCSDSLSLRRFIGVPDGKRVPDHSTLSRMRQRLDESVFSDVFDVVLGLVNSHGLLKGVTFGADSTQLRADASMKAIVRKDTGESYQEYTKRLAAAEGEGKPSADDARRHDRKRKGKKTSNTEWESKTDEDARIARMKNGTTRLAHKAEHVVDLDSGAIVEVALHPANEHDTATLEKSLTKAIERIEAVQEKKSDEPRELVTDKGYHKLVLLVALAAMGFRTFIPEPKQRGERHWVNKPAGTKEAFHQNRARCGRKKGKRLLRSRGELLERPNAHLYETGAMRRLRLRGRANAEKRLVIHAAAANLGLVMRKKYGAGTPRGAAQRAAQFFASMLATCWGQLLLALGFLTGTKALGRPASPSHSAAANLAAASSSTGC
jgi:transposase